MIQFNLLPDVKLQYLKTRRTKRLVMIISIVASAVSLALLVIMILSVQVAQKTHLKHINTDIKSEEKKLNDTPDLNKILTIQNQLNSLPQLHGEKPVASRLFGYVQKITPVQANISKFSIDFLANTITIDGTADSLVVANQYADTLKFATFKSSTTESGKPFSDVVTTLSKNDKKASFTLVFNFDPVLFQSSEVPALNVPKIISTRSATEKPEEIFKESPKPGGN